ncbi:MAG: CCA tRNA nucleotidyltransferase [Alphaproteobacteria bacterium]|jgi:poly(A) polymerase|nr:CCA tRNA nucleotidyltransferase [Alphaproteobacteria bacterium]
MRSPQSVALMAALTAEGDIARFVGGCVRDAVAGRPVTDIDVATSGAPETNTRLLQAAGIKVVPTGIAHGTLTALTGGRHFEVTTLRRDVETFGRHARVAFTDDWLADASRRDFTMNALYADPDGTLYDPAGGIVDLESGRVRFVGRAARRIAEDRLRILRFFRFHAWYGRGRANRAAIRACEAAAAGIDVLSGERIRQELMKLLAAPRPLPALRLMARHRVLERILTGGADLAALASLIRREETEWAADPLMRLAALMTGQGAAAAEGLAVRLRFSNADRDRLRFLLARPVALRAGVGRREVRRAVYEHGPERIVDLARLIGRPQAASEAQRLERPEFPLRGRDGRATGIAAGPRLGALLAAVEAWWVAGDFAADRDACLSRLRELAGTDA